MMSTRVQETTTRTNQIRGQLNLARHPLFTREYGEYKQTVCGFIRYEYAGYVLQLRFSQVSNLWTAYCSQLDAEAQFLNASPQDIIILLNNWIDGLQAIDIDSFQIRPVAHMRQQLPAVRTFARRHGLSRTEALEIMMERGD